MARLVSSELSDALSLLPDAQALSSISSLLKADLFLCALGFEPRCLSAPKYLRKRGFKASRGVYFEPSTNRSDNQMNLPALTDHLRAMCKSIDSLQADDIDFADRLRRLLSVLAREKGGAPLVVLDMSVLPNRIVMRTMKALIEADIDLIIVYSEAKIYHPTKEELDGSPSEWSADDKMGLERGVANVMPSREYPGQHLDPFPDFLILFPTFKAQRTKAVIARVDPSLLAVPADKIFWLIGIPHLEENRWRVDALRKLNGISNNVPQIEVSTFDYKVTLSTLDAVYRDKCMEYNITISPLGSKLQAVGTSLFCHMHPDVRVMFAIPKEYNAAHYSEGSGAIWGIQFGLTSRLRSVLDSIGTLKVEG
jgi:hypothetical protein